MARAVIDVRARPVAVWVILQSGNACSAVLCRIVQRSAHTARFGAPLVTAVANTRAVEPGHSFGMVGAIGTVGANALALWIAVVTGDATITSGLRNVLWATFASASCPRFVARAIAAKNVVPGNGFRVAAAISRIRA